MNCPGSEQAAAYADGRLDAAEAALFLEHCAECDSCRRELAVLSLPRESSPVPPGMKTRTLRAIREHLPRPMRHLARAPRSPLGWAAAAALLLAFAGLLAMIRSRETRVAPPKEVVQRKAAPAPQPPRRTENVVVPQPSLPRQEPLPPQIVDVPRPAPQPLDEPRIEIPSRPNVPEVARPEETRPEEPARPPSHTIVARVLSELQVTDLTGSLTLRRKGSGVKEKLSGVARLSEGDLLTADKPSSFQVEGRHPVVLGENTTVSLAYVAQEEAPYLHIRSGEAMVDSTGPTRWVVTDGRVALVIKQARARFATVPGSDRMSVTSLTEPLYVEPDGGQVHVVRPGEELQVGRATADVRPLDPALVAKKGATFEASRPRQRTIFYTSCDPADARRDHFFVQDGAWFKNEALVSRERPDRTISAAISPNPRFVWGEKVVVRFRYMTNAQAFQISLRADERKYTLFKNVTVERKGANQWLSAEMPLAANVNTLAFKRDDGLTNLVVSPQDKFDVIRFTVRQQDVFGDQKAYVLIDDVQVVEKE